MINLFCEKQAADWARDVPVGGDPKVSRQTGQG
jgi:hypothetical protein